MNDRVLFMEITRVEATHFAGLVEQFIELLDGSGTGSVGDPAVSRLVPDAYPDDAEASEDFRRVTQPDLLDRRLDEARIVLASLTTDGIRPDGPGEDDLTAPIVLALDGDRVTAWLRTLAALRLVLASRLGIEHEDQHDEADPRFGIYDWLGYRLDGLVRAVSSDRP